MADDSTVLRELCHYQSQELKVLKGRLEDCKCTKGLSESSADIDLLRSLKAELDSLKTLLATKDEELDKLRSMTMKTEDATEDANPKIVLQIMDQATGTGDRQQGETVDWQEKHSTLRTKYKTVKASHAETSVTLEQTRTNLESAVAALKAVKDDAMLHKRPAVRRIDDFRNGATTSSPTTTPSLSSIKVFCRGMTTTAFRELIPAKPAPLMIDDADCIFIAGGLSRILFLTPTHRFAPSNGPGGVSSSWSWTEAKSLFDVEGVRNVILSARSGYKYLGSYRCTFRHDLSFKEISDLRGQLPDTHIPSLARKTISGTDLVPPFMTKSVLGMYESGVMGATVHGLEWVGFDQSLTDSIRSIVRTEKKKVARPARQTSNSTDKSSLSAKRNNSTAVFDQDQGKRKRPKHN